jgi:hypothetical protein
MPQPLLRIPSQSVLLLPARGPTDQQDSFVCLVQCLQIAKEVVRAVVDEIPFPGVPPRAAPGLQHYQPKRHPPLPDDEGELVGRRFLFR